MDNFTREWITENALEICDKYEPGVLTIRGLHYQLVARGMTNSMRHYKRVVGAMIAARRDGSVSYFQFSDRDRDVSSFTQWEQVDYDDKKSQAERQIELWMSSYRLNRWSNQTYYPEVWIEKKALIGSFEKPCRKWDVGLAACKGYPSLTFLNEAAQRFKRAYRDDRTPVIIYFGDYDPSGEDIPRSIKDNLWADFGVDVEVHRVALKEDQVIAWGLPPAPAKTTDSRTANWDGLGQVELDAVPPEQLAGLVNDAIDDFFQEAAWNELKEREAEEEERFIAEMKEFVKTL